MADREREGGSGVVVDGMQFVCRPSFRVYTDPPHCLPYQCLWGALMSQIVSWGTFLSSRLFLVVIVDPHTVNPLKYEHPEASHLP